jgi:hypothetical protein
MRRRQNVPIVLALIALLLTLYALTSCTRTTGEVKAPEPIIRTATATHTKPQAAALDCRGGVRRYPWEENDVRLIAKTLYGETRSDEIPTDQKAAVAWCILNRVDAGWGTIEDVVTAASQFTGYRASNPVWDSLYKLTLDVLHRWAAEHDGAENVGRTLPADYLYFTGDGDRNNFTKKWKSGEPKWDWSLESPYKN